MDDFPFRGKHEVMSFGELNVGKWEYLKDERTIKMTSKGRFTNQKIIALNDNELILRIENGEIEILMRFKK